MSENNPFQDIEPNDEAPMKLKGEVFTSLHTMKVIFKVSEHFTTVLGSAFTDAVTIVLGNEKNENPNK